MLKIYVEIIYNYYTSNFTKRNQIYTINLSISHDTLRFQLDYHAEGIVPKVGCFW